MTRAREAADKLRAVAAQKVEELLTDDQKAALDKLKGEPFDLSTLRQGPEGPFGGDADRTSGDGNSPAPAPAKSKSRRGGGAR